MRSGKSGESPPVSENLKKNNIKWLILATFLYLKEFS